MYLTHYYRKRKQKIHIVPLIYSFTGKEKQKLHIMPLIYSLFSMKKVQMFPKQYRIGAKPQLMKKVLMFPKQSRIGTKPHFMGREAEGSNSNPKAYKTDNFI